MTENQYRGDEPRDDKTIELSESFEKSLTGSAETIGIDPSEGFELPTMALDSFEPESE